MYFFIGGGIILLALIIATIVYFVKRKNNVVAPEPPVVLDDVSKKEIDKKISESSLNEFLEEGEKQLEIGNLSGAKKAYKRLLHEYDSLDVKDKATYDKIMNFYNRILVASKK